MAPAQYSARRPWSWHQNCSNPGHAKKNVKIVTWFFLVVKFCNQSYKVYTPWKWKQTDFPQMMYLRASSFGDDFGYLFVKVLGGMKFCWFNLLYFFCSQLKYVFFVCFKGSHVPNFWVSKPWAMDLYILGRSKWCIQQKSIRTYI